MREAINRCARDLPTLIGAQLIEIDLKIQSVSLIFLGDLTLDLSINKEFEFTLADGVSRAFSPVGSANTPFHEYSPRFEAEDVARYDATFLFFRGLSCVDASITDRTLKIVLEREVRITVVYDARDFEPVHYTGYDGTGDGALRFMHVL